MCPEVELTPDMIPLVFMEGAELDQCLEINAMSYADAIAAKPKIAGLKNADPEQQLGCIKRVGFEEGIPLHKIRAFHFWLGVRHPLRGKSHDGQELSHRMDIVPRKLLGMVGRFWELLPRCVAAHLPVKMD